MQRRSLLQLAASAAALIPFPSVRAWGQTAGFPGSHAAGLRLLGAVVLPDELTPAGRDRVVALFEKWVREYRAGADTDHGYGHTSVRPKGPSPASVYIAQLGQLGPSLFSGDTAAQRAAIETALEDAHIKELPRIPDGRHVAADLMAFYFRSSDANDLCYRAEIGRDKCRGLAGSENPPPPRGQA